MALSTDPAVGGPLQTTTLNKLVAAMRGNGGLSWGEHHPCLFSGTERFFRPGYRAHLTAEWLPALDDVVRKLEAGATVADVGCGHGASTVIMAQAFHASKFFGFDSHAPSIDTARERAAKSGIADRATFEVANAKTYPAHDYDLICFFDCLHDMGDPVGAARHAHEMLAPEGTVLLVEPFAGDRLDDTRIQSGACSTQRPRSFAPRIRSPRRSHSGWAHRRAKRGCATSSPRRASPVSAAPQKLRST